MLTQNEPSKEKINRWGEFIKRYSSVRSFVVFLPLSGIGQPALRTSTSLDNILTDQLGIECDFLIDTQSIQKISALFPRNIDLTYYNDINIKREKFYNIANNAYRRGLHEKMTFRKYLIWRLKLINDDKKKPISLKATIVLAFSSLVGVYWFFTPETKPLIKILMGILNLLIVAALVCTIVFNLSIYFLLPAAIVYVLFAIADCIHVGLKSYKENVEYQTTFGNTYDELMEYLEPKQIKPLQPLINKMNSAQKEKRADISEDIKSYSKEESEDSESSDSEDEKSI